MWVLHGKRTISDDDDDDCKLIWIAVRRTMNVRFEACEKELLNNVVKTGNGPVGLNLKASRLDLRRAFRSGMTCEC